MLKKRLSVVLVKWRRTYRGVEGERSHFSAEFYKLFSCNKNQSIEPRSQTLNQSRSWLRAEIYFSFIKILS